MQSRLSFVYAGLALLPALLGVACSDGSQDAEQAGRSESSLVLHSGGGKTPRGVTVRVTGATCPTLDVDGSAIAGVPSVAYLADIESGFSADAVARFVPIILGDAYPNALRAVPLYCVYDTGALAPMPPQADVEAAASRLSDEVSIATLWDLPVPLRSGHQCIPCPAVPLPKQAE